MKIERKPTAPGPAFAELILGLPEGWEFGPEQEVFAKISDAANSIGFLNEQMFDFLTDATRGSPVFFNRLEKVYDTPARIWLDMKKKVDEWEAAEDANWQPGDGREAAN